MTRRALCRDYMLPLYHLHRCYSRPKPYHEIPHLTCNYIMLRYRADATKSDIFSEPVCPQLVRIAHDHHRKEALPRSETGRPCSLERAILMCNTYADGWGILFGAISQQAVAPHARALSSCMRSAAASYFWLLLRSGDMKLVPSAIMSSRLHGVRRFILMVLLLADPPFRHSLS